MVVKTFFLIVIGGILSCLAQEKSVPNSYFKSYDDKVIANVYFLDVSNTFRINSKETNGTRVTTDLIPNRREQIGISISYKFADISYGFSPHFFNDNKDNAHSKLATLSSRFIVKQWMQTLSYINQKGFYIEEGSTTVSFPALRTTKIGGITSYICNPKFSFKAIANQKEWQTKSSGSFIPNFSFFYTNLDLNNENPNAKSSILEMTLSPSYFYNFVIHNRILLSAGLSAGFGISNIDGDISGVVESSSNFKLGYNTDAFFGFLKLNFITFTQQSTTPFQLNDQISTVNLLVGYRFNPPKRVVQVFETVHQKTGI